MAKEKKYLLPVDYARKIGVSPTAITKQMKKNQVKVKLVKGRRFIEVED
ncbi:MAG: hypothetical protein ACOVMM_04645 [Chitinophagaceae bacterium]